VIVLLFLLFLVVALPFRLVGMLTEYDPENEPENEGDPAGEHESEAASTRAARAAAIPASEGVQSRVRIDATNTR
jgi:Na+-transporting methylmalonyl-CoA/oxaloacetate decarboxylase gamma subunit